MGSGVKRGASGHVSRLMADNLLNRQERRINAATLSFLWLVCLMSIRFMQG